MPVKIGFTVVCSTGEDERYRATDLNYHGPTVKGWRSSQFCSYPQELTLLLNSPSIIHRIQILAHQYLIPQKIEIWTCEDMDYDPALSPNGTQLFKYLGFITLSDNQATGFKSRELKSVTTPPTFSRFVRLRLHGNHTNDRNLYNQVGLVAVSVLGEPIPQDEYYGDEVNNNGQYDSLQSSDATLISNPQYTSPYDDLAFEMYVDSDVARIMRLMEAKKHQAVIEERFEYARKLKLALEELREAGETLGRLEQEKRQAINLEDYDKAKAKKLQIERYRDKVYTSLQVEQLLELEGNFEENDWSPGNVTIYGDRKKELHGLMDQVTDHRDLEEPIISPPQRLEVDTRSPRHPRYIESESPQFSEPIITWSPRRPRRRTSLSEAIRPTSPILISHSFSQNTFPASLSSHHLRCSTPQFQSCTPYPFQQALGICQSSSSEIFHSLPPVRQQESFQATQEKNVETFKETQSKIPIPERSKSPTNSNTSNMSRSPTNTAIRPSTLRGSLRKRNKSNGAPSKSSYEAYEERMLPALRHPHFHGNDVVRECQMAVDQVRKSKLNERERKQAALPISVYGIEMVEKFYSKHFADKEEGLRLLQEQLKIHMKGPSEEEGNTNPSQQYSANKMARAAIFLMHRALRDKVYSVYSAAAEAVRFFFNEFLPGRLSAAEVARSVEKLVPELISKSGDVTPRIHNMAAHTLLSMADCKEVRDLHIIPVQLSRPLSSSVHPRLALSRLEMVEQLILNHGISSEKQSGLTCRTLAEFGTSGLHHPAEAVRKVSERILLHVYKVNPRLVRKQLPPDDDVTRRNLLYRHLFQEFDLMDTQKQEQKFIDAEPIKSATLPKPSKAKHQEHKKIGDGVSGGSEEAAQEIVKSKSDHAVHAMSSQIPKRTVNQQTSPMRPFMPPGFGICAKDENENRVPKATTKALTYGTNGAIQVGCGTLNGDSDKVTGAQTHLRAVNPAEKIEQVLKRRSMSRISEEIVETDSVKEKKTSIVHFPNLVDSLHIAEAKNAQKSLKYIFPTSYIGTSTTSQETVNKANSTTTFCKMNPEFSLGKSFPPSVSGIPIPKNGFNGNRGGGFFNSLLFTKKFTNKFSGKKVEQEETAMTRDDPLARVNMTTAVYIPAMDTIEGQPKGPAREPPSEENSSPASVLTPPSEVEAATPDVAEEKEGQTYKTCIFCFAKEDWFTEESLNIHYWKNCPMLTRCKYCQEVVEVSGLIQHRLDDCESKEIFRKCINCLEAILKEEYDSHDCQESRAPSTKTRCTLCHKDLVREEDWREHLMGVDLCQNHPRKNEQS